MGGIKSPLLKVVYELEGVRWLGQDCIMITKVPVVIINGDCWEQNIEMLIWLGGNVLGYPLGILFCGTQ